MRHNKKVNHLSRTSAHRKAMMANMANSLIQNKRITTTLAKAKALRTYVEPLITKAKKDTTHSRRVVFSYLQDKESVSVLFREIAEKIADRPGGYTRILKTGTRLGDNAEMCIIELVDYNETMLASKEGAAKSKRRRSRRGAAAKKDEATPVASTKKKQQEKAAIIEDVEPIEELEQQTETEAEVDIETENASESTETAETDDKASEDEEKEEE